MHTQNKKTAIFNMHIKHVNKNGEVILLYMYVSSVRMMSKAPSISILQYANRALYLNIIIDTQRSLRNPCSLAIIQKIWRAS
jgi:hypothetical protein